jgi:hypothetical protein
VDDLTQLPTIVANAVFVALANTGVDVTPFMIQITILASCIVGLIVALTALRRTRLVASMVFTATILIIAYTWSDLIIHPLKPYVKAEPNPIPKGRLDVKIYDFRNFEIQASAPKVVPAGDVEVEYYQTFGDWPRRLELSAPGCAKVSKALNLAMLRDQRPIPISVDCNG